jgi:integrase
MDMQKICKHFLNLTTMAKLTIKLDKRSKNKDGEHTIKFYLTHNGQSTFINTGVAVQEKHFVGDIDKVVKSACPNANQINIRLAEAYLALSNKIYAIKNIDRLSVAEVKKIITRSDDETDQSFCTFFARYIETKKGKTKEAYLYTQSLIEQYTNGSTLEFADVNYKFLSGFDAWLEDRGNKINSRSIHFRNIRAAYNNAIDTDVCPIELYPFRKFKIKTAKKDKVYLDVELMRELINLEIPSNMPSLERCRDMFLLSFFLCGANPVDLYNMPQAENGIIKFVRTKIRHHEPEYIKIKIQPEAQAIIDRYRGTNTLLNISDEFVDYQGFYNSIKMRIRKLGEMIGVPNLTMYYARYSWATYASKIGVDESVIGKALGHTDVSLAGSRYISFDWSRVDDANRKVIDYTIK